LDSIASSLALCSCPLSLSDRWSSLSYNSWEGEEGGGRGREGNGGSREEGETKLRLGLTGQG